MSAKNNLQEWLASINCVESFTPIDLISGNTVHKILSNIIKPYSVEINTANNSVLHRVETWNVLIQQLKKIEINVTQQSKGKIVNGNQDSVIDIIIQLKQYHLKLQRQSQVDLANIDAKKDPNEAQSLLELLLILIMKNFSLSSKESVALLSNEGKYLAHILTKGLKGQFKHIEHFISDLAKYKQKIFKFCKSSENSIFFMRSIKPALISKSQIVSLLCFNFFNQFMARFSQIEQSEMLNTHLFSTYMLAAKRHPNLEQKILLNVFEIGKYDENILEKFFQNSNQKESENIFLTILNIFSQAHKFESLRKIKNVDSKILESVSNISKQGFTCTSLNIVLLTFKQSRQFFDNKNTAQLLIQKLSETQPINSAQYYSFINQCFALLEAFGMQKHFIAPSIFKILISKFKSVQSLDECEIFLKNFQQIIEVFPSIPWQMVLQTLQTIRESQKIEIAQSQLLFLYRVLDAENMDLKYALLIYDIVSRLFMQTFHLSGLSIKIIAKIIDIFREQEIVQQLSLKLVKVCLAVHFANFKKLTQKRKSLTGNSKMSSEQVMCKIKNNAIEFLLLKTCQLKDAELNKQMEPLLIFSYINIKQSKQHSRGLKKVISLLGNAEQLIEQYQKQLKMAEQQAKIKASKINQKNKSRYESPQQDDGNDSQLQNSPLNRKGHTQSMHRPLGMSYVGVTRAAQKGIQKFQRVYLEKIQKQDLDKIKLIQEQERQQMLKKLYKKKMLSNGIDIKGQSDQIRYIFEFDSKQNVILEKNLLKVPYYTNQSEEERDIKAIDQLMKTYTKPLKLIFTQYVGHKKGFIPQNFDQYAEKNVYISSSNIYKFAKDFYLEDYISLKEIQALCQKINLEKNPDNSDFQLLNFDCFIQIIKQMSFVMFTRPPKDLRGHPLSSMLEETFSNLKLFANQNRINQKNFEQPSNLFFNETQAVAQLNRKLVENPDYILPDGYKKIIEKKISFEYGIYLEAMSSTYKAVFEVLDDILFSALDFHVIQPFTRTETIARARPTLFVAQRIKLDSVTTKHIPVILKKQIAKTPIKSRMIAKECAISLQEIIQAVQLGHSSVGQKHMNKVILEKKAYQQNLKKQYYLSKRRMQSRNRQAKTAIQQYKDIRQEKDREASQKKKNLEKKLKQDKEKREKQEKQLKRKVQQYAQKKKEQEKQKLKIKKEQEEKERKEREKFKQTNDETKRKIQEQKRRRQQEQKEKVALKKKQEKIAKENQMKKMAESQIIKKKMVEEYKMKKSGIKDSNLSMSGKDQTKNLESHQDEKQNNQD